MLAIHLDLIRNLSNDAVSYLKRGLEHYSQLDRAFVVATALALPEGTPELRTKLVHFAWESPTTNHGEIPIAWDDLARGLELAIRGDVKTIKQIYSMV